ncbi:MAG: class I SAM-dependent methyltransferase [Gemmatimonadota bacterium]
MKRRAHWERIWASRAPREMSWHQECPDVSLQLIRRTGLPTSARILDAGGGASRLVDCLLDEGYEHPGVLDIAPTALAAARDRLGPAAARVEWIEGDVMAFETPHPWDVWHDRAVFHFLARATDRAAYRAALHRSLSPAGWVVLATFGPGAPPRCSGLDVVRYDAQGLAREIGAGFELVEARSEDHATPAGATQAFTYCLLRRAGPAPALQPPSHLR